MMRARGKPELKINGGSLIYHVAQFQGISPDLRWEREVSRPNLMGRSSSQWD